MKKSAKIVLAGIVLLVIAACIVWFSLVPKQVPLTHVTPKMAELSFTEQGEVAGAQVIQIIPLVQGEVVEVFVEEGKYVTAGEVICQIDPEPIREQMEQARSTITSYTSQMESQNSTSAEQQLRQQILIEQGEKDLAQAAADLERSRILYQDGFISQAEYEIAGQKVNQYRSALAVSRQELKIISESLLDGDGRSYYQSLIEIEQSKLKLLEKELEHSQVTAVADGIITALPVNETNYAGTEPVAELTAMGPRCIEVYVSDHDISTLAPGTPVRLTLNRREGDVEFGGTIARIGDTATMKVSALGLEERKVKVEITPEPGEMEAMLGMGYSVDVHFLLYQQDQQLTVPKTALFKQDGMDMVWLVRNGSLRAVPVTTGMELRTETVILEGLEPGSYVVTDANDQELKERLRVVVR